MAATHSCHKQLHMKRAILLLLLFGCLRLAYAQDVIINNVVAMEYFFDDDPGVGNANALVTSPNTTVTESFSISTSSLTEGFHTLYLRAQDQTGAWGLPESRLIYVDLTDAASTTLVAGIEYFFDTDPGIGKGTRVAATSQAQIAAITANAAASTLSQGFHNLFIRVEDENGRFGIYESRLLYVDPSGAGAAVEVEAIEYFFDTDPGVGNGTEVLVGTAASVVEVISNISTDALATGFHNLYIRPRAVGG